MCYRNSVKKESLHGFIVLIELRGSELHFGAEHLERLVDICQCLFKFFFTLKTVFSPKLSAMYRHLLVDGMKKASFNRDVGTKPSEVLDESLLDGMKKERPRKVTPRGYMSYFVRTIPPGRAAGRSNCSGRCRHRHKSCAAHPYGR